jgi:VCBS repeat-containing protein
VTPTAILNGSQTTNTLTWSFNSGSEAFNFLATGETLVLTYTVSATDDDGSPLSDTETVTVTITGTADTPVITGGPDTSSLTETNAGLSDTGTFTVTDLDLTDNVTAAVDSVVVTGTGATSVPAGLTNATLRSFLSVTPTAILDGSQTTNSLTWNFNSVSEAFNFLATGETLVLTYTVSATDDDGSPLSDTETVTITITGTADAPVITGGPDTSSLSETNAGLSDSGTFTVTDLDLTDNVTAAVDSVVVTGTGAGSVPSGLTNATLRNFLSVTPTAILNGSQTTNTLTWNFNSGSEAFNFLSTGETLVLTYTVSATDDDGSPLSDTEKVTITITGTNDLPLITVGSGDSAAETLTETNATLTSSGTLTVSDLDLTDLVFSNVTGVVASGTTAGLGSNHAALLAMLTSTANVLDETELTDKLTWNFNSGSEAFNYLATGESLTLTYTIAVEDSQGAIDNQVVTITITGTADAPVITGGPDTSSLTETNAGLSDSGTFTVTDLDLTDNVTAAVDSVVVTGTGASSVPAGLTNATLRSFLSVTPTAILNGTQTSNTLTWNFNSGSEAFDFLATNETLVLTYTVSATDDDGSPLSDTENITVTITGTNDGPIAVVDSNTAVEAGGVYNGTLGTNPSGNVFDNDTDADVVDTKTVTGVSAGTAASAVGSVSSGVMGTFGSISIAADGSYTYTVDNSNPTVQALRTISDTLQDVFTYTMRDTDGVTSTTQVTITIQGANDTPFDIVGGGLNVDENATNGTLIGSVLGQDLDSGDSFMYNLLDSAGGRFAIDNAGQITVANGLLLDRENHASHTITVQVVDASGATFSKNFGIAINDVDEFDVTLAADTDNTSNRVDENATTGTLVGITSFATDDDATTNNVSYTLSDDAGGRFAIDATTGVVTVADGSLLDYEANISHQITVRAISIDGSVSDTDFTIQLNDMDEFDVSPITDLANVENGVAENSATGTDVGLRANAFDADETTNTITYSLTNNDGGRFAINPVTGQVTVAGAIDREADGSSRTVTIRATSADGSISEEIYLINIYDVDEFDSVILFDSDSAANRVNENSAIGTQVGYQAFGRDADATNNVITYSLDNDANGSFAIDSATGLLTTAKSLNYEATARLTVIVRATSSDGSFALTTAVIQVLNVFEAPIGTNDSFSTSYIDKLTVQTVGVLGNDVDPDGDSITAILVSGPSSGQIVFLSNGMFQYTPVPGFLGTVDIVYQAFDGLLRSEPITISIDVLLPDNLPGDNGGRSDSSSSGTGDGGSTTSNGDAAGPVPIGGLDQATQATDQVVEEVILVSGVATEGTVATQMVLAMVEEKKELALATFMEVSSRSYSESDVGHNMLRRRGEEHHLELHKSSDDELIHFSNASQKAQDESIEAKSSSVESLVFSTVVGTGMILWVVQGAQLAATLISVSPAWMQLDPLAVLNNADGKLKKEELTAGEKLFD